MKRLLFFILLLITSVDLVAQVKFEKGYFINTQGERKEGFIKNLDWEYNPESFEFKLEEGGSAQKVAVTEAREFAIGKEKKYLSALVKIDSSSDILAKTTLGVAPLWYTKRVFAKVLVDGNMSLYSYRTSGYHRFYYKLKSDSITPLVYKRYLRSNQMGYNKQYIMQLERLLDCGDLNKKANVNYATEALTDLVNRYNQCTNSSVVNYQLEKKLAFSAKITAGVNYSSYKAFINGGFFTKGADFGKTITPRLGLEMEMLLPYWENRWSIVFDPNYRTYKSEVTSGGDKFSVDYVSIELPAGIRTHFFLKGSKQIFADIYFVVEKHLGDTPINLDGTLYEERSSPNYALSLGYNSNKFSVAVRGYSIRNLAPEYPALNNSFKNISLIASYQLFRSASR
jgi:hypothetical protein